MAEGRGPGPATIERCVAAWQRAKHALEADEQLATDEEVLALALEADPTALPPEELLRRFVAAIVFAEARKAEAKTIAESLRAREQRYASRAMVLRSELLEVMQALERSSFAAPYGTVSVKRGVPSVFITDEQALPDKYVRVVTTRKPDKHALLAALKALQPDAMIPGAVLSNAMPVLAISSDKARDPEAMEDAS